jgi:DNA-binding Lrp family transcriptional regulator
MGNTKALNLFGNTGKMTSQSLDIAHIVLRNPHISYQAMADQYGISRQRVGQIVRKMGVARRDRDGEAN